MAGIATRASDVNDILRSANPGTLDFQKRGINGFIQAANDVTYENGFESITLCSDNYKHFNEADGVMGFLFDHKSHTLTLYWNKEQICKLVIKKGPQ